MRITPRDYQKECFDGFIRCLREHRSALGCLPTGMGKTIVFSMLADVARGRSLIVCPSRELVAQAADKLKMVTGISAGVEMGDQRSSEHSGLFAKPRAVVTTYQTMSQRLHSFARDEFGLIIVDEAHHSTASSYQQIFAHFTAKIAGLTATPDRRDKKALRSVYSSVAYDMDYFRAIELGWLVEPLIVRMPIRSVSFQDVSLGSGGDFPLKAMHRLESEEAIGELVGTLIRETGDGAQTIVFAGSVQQARLAANAMNRPVHKPGSAAAIDAETKTSVRDSIINSFHEGRIQYLFNFGIATEGFDAPNCQCVAIGRPIGSRSLMAQMVGRGSRPEPGCLDGCSTPEERRLAIAMSGKPNFRMLDFDDNAQSHSLIHPADILGGIEMTDEEREKVRVAVQREVGDRREVTMTEMKRITEKKLSELRMDDEEEKRKAGLRYDVEYVREVLDPWGIKINNRAKKKALQSQPLSSSQIDQVRRAGVDCDVMSMPEIRSVYNQIVHRRVAGKCTLKMAKILKQHGYPPDLSMSAARDIIQNRIFKRPAR